MKEKYQKLFFKYLFDLLKLNEYEAILINKKIDYIENEIIMCQEEINCKNISKYFYLLNNVNLDALSEEEKNYLNIIHEDLIDDNVISFLNKTYEKVLLIDSNNLMISYGPTMDNNYTAPGDAIVLGIKYDQYGFAKAKVKNAEQVRMEEKVVSDIIKQIETKSPIKIKIIVYSEIYEKLNRRNRLI